MKRFIVWWMKERGWVRNPSVLESTLYVSEAHRFSRDQAQRIAVELSRSPVSLETRAFIALAPEFSEPTDELYDILLRIYHETKCEWRKVNGLADVSVCSVSCARCMAELHMRDQAEAQA